MPRPAKSVIRRRALRVLQDKRRPLYLFTLRADEILQIAEISRISRDNASELIGYQRPEVRRHVQNILSYLDHEDGHVLFPNSIILSLSSAVIFRQVRGPKVDDGIAAAGTIEFPIPRAGAPKPAWIVDGQQRALALSRCKRRDFPVAVNAFVADDLDTQREQFLLVNSTKPLPRGLITELLPKVNTLVPSNLAMRRAPSALCDILNSDPESPFFKLIHRASSSHKASRTEVISDNSIIRLLQESLSNPSGCLFSYRNVATGQTDFAAIRKLLVLYWNGVKTTFPTAWGLPPKRSRLMHSAGLYAMGRLMDRVMGGINIEAPDAQRRVIRELAPLVPVCRWTSGTWEELRLGWNEIQTVPPHMRMLTNFLLRTYLDSRGTGR